MKQQPPIEDLTAYKKWGLTILQLMALLATVGVVVTVVLNHFFY